MKRPIISAFVLGLLTLAACEENKQVKESLNIAEASVNNTVKTAISTKEFTEKAYAGNMAEVQLGELAKKKATNKDVKQFAEMLIKDHSKANDQLKDIAKKKNISVPDKLTTEMKNKMNDLQSKSGKDFDKAYMDFMVKEHKKDIDFYEKSMKDIQDSEYSQYISNTLPVLKKHHEKAMQINQTLESTASMKE